MNVVILKSASLSIAVAMICRAVFWIFTGFLHTSVQCLVWLLLSPVADPSSGEPKHALCPTKETVRGVILPQENQGQQKCFLDDLGALMLSCHRKAQQCTCAWMEVGLLVRVSGLATLWSDQDMTIPWPIFCNSWFTDIFALLKFPWHERKKL